MRPELAELVRRVVAARQSLATSLGRLEHAGVSREEQLALLRAADAAKVAEALRAARRIEGWRRIVHAFELRVVAIARIAAERDVMPSDGPEERRFDA